MSPLAALRYVTFMALLALVGCAWLGSTQGKQAEKDVLRMTEVACILEHSMFPTPAIEEACHIEHTLAPAIEELLAEHKAAAQREQRIEAARALFDAGAKGKGDIPACDAGPTADAAFDGAQFGTRK